MPLTSSTSLNEEHLWLILEQRTAGVIKNLKHPVQLRDRERVNETLISKKDI